MALDYTTLHRAIKRLKEAIDKYEKYKDDAEFGDTVQDSLVKRFEFTLEHSLKMIEKTLKEIGFSKKQLEPRKQLLRVARDQELIEEFEKWNNYMKSRNTTSHEYSEDTVTEEEYIELIQNFYADVQKLLQNLESIRI